MEETFILALAHSFRGFSPQSLGSLISGPVVRQSSVAGDITEVQSLHIGQPAGTRRVSTPTSRPHPMTYLPPLKPHLSRFLCLPVASQSGSSPLACELWGHSRHPSSYRQCIFPHPTPALSVFEVLMPRAPSLSVTFSLTPNPYLKF